jgi:hypothetical protein
MDDSTEVGPKLLQRWQQFSSDVESLLRSPSYPLAEADLPKVPGVYVIIDEQLQACYVGKATRSLRDRVLSKHVSGDESHALQHAYKDRFPNRLERRKFLRENLRVKWLRVDDLVRIADLERLLIWLCKRGSIGAS